MTAVADTREVHHLDFGIRRSFPIHYYWWLPRVPSRHVSIVRHSNPALVPRRGLEIAFFRGGIFHMICPRQKKKVR